MVSPIGKFFRWLTNSDKPEKILTPYNPDVEENIIIKEQAKKIQALEGQISKIRADKVREKVIRDNVSSEIELIEELQKKSQSIEREKYHRPFSLLAFYKRLLTNKNFAEKLELVDKDDKKVFDKFKTFVILDNGSIAIMGKSGEVWAEGNNLDEIIFKPETFKNQIRRGRITLPYDENFNYIPDLEKVMMPEMSYDEEEDKWNISEERLVPFKEMIIDRDKRIFELREDKKFNEQTIADLRNKVREIDLAVRSWKSQAETSKAELSIALESARDTSSKMAEINRNYVVAQEQKLIVDNLNEKLNNILDKLAEQLEDEKSKTALRLAKDEIQADIGWARTQIPKEIHNTIVQESDEPPPLRDGQVLPKKQ